MSFFSSLWKETSVVNLLQVCSSDIILASPVQPSGIPMTQWVSLGHQRVDVFVFSLQDPWKDSYVALVKRFRGAQLCLVSCSTPGG